MEEIRGILSKEAFIPAPQPEQGAPQEGQGQAPPMDGGQGMPPGFEEALAQGQPPQGQAPQGGTPTGADPNAAAFPEKGTSQGGQVQNSGTPTDLVNSTVTLSHLDLLDLTSGGKATAALLKAREHHTKQDYKNRQLEQKFQLDEQKRQQNEQKQQQAQQEQMQEQNSMMGGGVY